MASRNDGFDFADRNLMVDHPDLPVQQNQPVHLQRNKTERSRLQGLQRQAKAEAVVKKTDTLAARFNVWMINEGGRQLFFAVFIFFHLLVAVFGFLHYQRKDNLSNARKTFGLGFCECFPFLATRQSY